MEGPFTAPKTGPFSAPEKILLSIGVEVVMLRSPRPRKCPDCHLKRVLIASAVYTNTLYPASLQYAGTSLYRCLECWGVRSHGA